MKQQLSISRLARAIRGPRLWFVVAVLVIITLAHYAEAIEHPAFLNQLAAHLGLSRHAVERIAYLAAVIWAGFLFGWKGTLITSAVALACMLPRAIFISPSPRDALLESSTVFIVGNLVAFTFQSLHRERERRTYLAALNRTSTVVSQSLELDQVLRGSIDSVMNVMKVDAALVFLVDEEAGEVALAAHQGLSGGFVQGLGRAKLGEGFSGKVTETGEPLYVEDAFQDPGLAKMAVKEEGIRSHLIVPLKSKGGVLGTLCVAMRGRRKFRKDEVGLLTAIGNQIAIAIENAHLYEQRREAAEQLRVSEERYRGLFEGAHDAIWLHNLQGDMITANKSFVRLTGYTLEELRGMKASDLITEGCMESIIATEDSLREGIAIGHLLEATLVKKDGTDVSVQLSTNPVLSDGHTVAFQHIARDVTEEKRMQENLHFYLGQITRAQEEERKRIARELHDESIQSLVVLSRQIDDLAISSKELSEDKRILLENLREQTDNVMEGIRRLSRDLRPPALDRLGLMPGLEWLASDFREYSGITAEVKLRGAERRLPTDAELMLFRITQEALRNVWRHSEATSAEVIVEFGEGKIRIIVKDNGKGFDPPKTMGDLVKDGRLGLAGMQERIQLLRGSVKIESEFSKGTTIMIEAPV